MHLKNCQSNRKNFNERFRKNEKIAEVIKIGSSGICFVEYGMKEVNEYDA